MKNSIFMIHGMWGGGWQWDRYRQFFEEKGYPCLAPTLRLHDVDPKTSPHPDLGTTSLLNYAADLKNEIKKLDHPPISIGHSIGGLLAKMLGSRGLATALVLLTPVPPAGVLALRLSAVRGVWSCITTWGFWHRPTRQTYGEAVYSIMNLLPAHEQKEMFDKFVFKSGRAMFEIGLFFLDRKRASTVDASRITCPVLVISGARDRIAPASVVRKIADRYGKVATYMEYHDHAHEVLMEPSWQDIAADIARWLNTELNEERRRES